MNPGQELIEAVVKAYVANRPEGLSAEVAFYPSMRTGERERPCVVVSTEDGGWLHPKLYACELVMTLEARKTDVQEDTLVPDEGETVVPAEDGGKVFAEWLGAIDGAMLGQMPAVRAALKAKGLKLTYIYPGDPAEVANGEDGFEGERRWRMRVGKSAE